MSNRIDWDLKRYLEEYEKLRDSYGALNDETYNELELILKYEMKKRFNYEE